MMLQTYWGAAMSSHLNVGKTALVLAIVMGGFHLVWSTLVALQWAQPLMDFAFWVHFIKSVYVVEPFEAARAAMLLVMTAGMGFAIGAAFAWVWNAFHKA
jgi:hypothetical protein